jgi:Domain of unknown function (DUF4136)
MTRTPRPCRVPAGGRTGSAVVLAVAACLLATAGAWLEAAKTDLTFQFDKTFSFVGLRTWAWHPDGKGSVHLALTAESDPKRLAGRVDPVIVPAVERELGARKFTIAASNPDLLVNYYVLATIGSSSQVQGQFLPTVPEWGLPPFPMSTTALEVYPVGTVLIDVTDPKRQALVWRGGASRKLNLDSPDAERRKVLEKAIHDLLAKFPPPVKK